MYVAIREGLARPSMTYATFHARVLNAGVRAKAVHRRMSMDSITEADDVALEIPFCDYLVDIPF
jgi:hypothetical protein